MEMHRAREWDTPPVTLNGSAVVPLLIKHALQDMRQARCDKRRQKDVVTCASRACILVATIEPPAGSQRA